MSDTDAAERARRLKILNALFSKTKENGATEEEAAAAIDRAMDLMGKWQIEDYELGIVIDKRTNVKRELDLKYANKWRWELASSIAWNTGVYALHFKGGDKKESISYYGREQPVEAAAILAEYLIGTVEELARKTGLDVTGKRRFARGCSVRLRQRIYQSLNLTHDPRLPAIYKEAVKTAKLDYQEETGIKVKGKRTQTREEDSPEYIAGFRKGDEVDLRIRSKQISS